MANTNTPFGLALSRSQDGAYSGIMTSCYIPATNIDKLYVGDPVVISGSNDADFMDYKVGTLPSISKATASSAIDGVIVGFLPNGEFKSAGAHPASTAGVAFVINNPMAKFNIQATAGLANTDVGKYAGISVATAGDDYSGISGVALDSSTIAVNTALPLKIVGVADYLTNDAGTYGIAEVVINVKPAE